MGNGKGRRVWNIREAREDEGAGGEFSGFLALV